MHEGQQQTGVPTCKPNKPSQTLLVLLYLCFPCDTNKQGYKQPNQKRGALCRVRTLRAPLAPRLGPSSRPAACASGNGGLTRGAIGRRGWSGARGGGRGNGDGDGEEFVGRFSFFLYLFYLGGGGGFGSCEVWGGNLPVFRFTLAQHPRKKPPGPPARARAPARSPDVKTCSAGAAPPGGLDRIEGRQVRGLGVATSFRGK